ncbi:MAG: metallophosphoesterase [Planctomycetaceae bacterium]
MIHSRSPVAGWLGLLIDRVFAKRTSPGASRLFGRPNRRSARRMITQVEAVEQRLLLTTVRPYLQNPATNAMTVMWFTETNTPGTLTVTMPGGGTQEFQSSPEFRTELSYHASEPLTSRSNAPYMHRIRVTGLASATSYSYTVTQGAEFFSGQMRTIADSTSALRFIVYGDSETEPESTGTAVGWTDPNNPTGSRLYVADQTEGYRQNLNVIESRSPDFIGIAGDIVESGGEQRDWDEFWKQNAGTLNDLASSIPILASPGNHENFGGPGDLGGYGDAGSIRAKNKFATYWEAPSNGTQAHSDRYFRIDYGPITYISLDVTNGAAHATSSDTNWLLGSASGVPDFNPGSVQYQWLEAQLADAQTKSHFTFVQFHHVPYSTGPHGYSPGNGTGFDNQSGVPVRVLTPLFQQYGVDAVFSGHDEAYQHSLVDGVHFFDMGIGGDGLRGPSSGPGSTNPSVITNPYQVFTAHLNAPEVWNGNQLVSGGKHYGHMEVNVSFDAATGTWKAQLDPVYVFPLMNTSGVVTGWERRVYNDSVTLTANAAPTAIQLTSTSIAENQPANSVVGTLSSVDASGNTHTYQLVTGEGSTDNARFNISGNQLRTSESFNYEAKASYQIRVRSTDQDGLSTEQSFAITVNDLPESNPPVIGNAGANLTWREDAIPILLFTSATVSDTDSANFEGGVLTLSMVNGSETGDLLSIRSQEGVAGQVFVGPLGQVIFNGATIGVVSGGLNGAPLTVSLNASATAAAVQALVRNLRFSHTTHAPLNLSRLVQLVLTDGDGGTSLPVQKSITVVPLNDAPLITGFGSGFSWIENTVPSLIAPNVAISDVDSVDFNGGRLTVSVSVNAQTFDRISVRNEGAGPGQIGVTVSGSTTTVTYGGVAIGTLTGTSTLTVNLNANATVAAVQALLRNVTFSNISDAPSTLPRTIMATVSDGDGGTSPAVTKTVQVIAVNDAPVIEGFGTTTADQTVAYLENAPPVLVDSNAVVKDPDLLNFEGGVLTAAITANFRPEDRLKLLHQGDTAGRVGIDSTTGVVRYGGVPVGTFTGGTSQVTVTFNSAAMAAAVQAVLRVLAFSTESDNPSLLPRTVRVTLSDGDGGISFPVTKSIAVTPVNDAPVVTGFGGGTSWTENAAPVLISPNALITDIDSPNFEGGQLVVSVTTNAHASDRISVRHVGTGGGQIGVTVSGSTTTVTYEGVAIGTLTGTTKMTVLLNANATIAAVQALLRQVVFSNISEAPSTLTRTITASVNDGDRGTSSLLTKTIQVTATNDAPVIEAFGTPAADQTVTYRENSLPVLIDSNAIVKDPDLLNFEGAVLTASLTANSQAADRLQLLHQGDTAGRVGIDSVTGTVRYGGVVVGSVTGGNGATPLVVTFNASAQVAAVQAVLRVLAYSTDSHNPSTLARTIQVTLTDGDGGTSAPVSKTIAVTAVNDAPVISGFDGSQAIANPSVATIIDTNAMVEDVDSTNLASGVLTVSVSANAHPSDRLSVLSQGDAPGQIRVSVNPVSSSTQDVFFGGVLIGQFATTTTTSLRVTLNSNANSAAVTALLRRVAFRNISVTPSLLPRTISATLSDGDGGTSMAVTRTLTLS